MTLEESKEVIPMMEAMITPVSYTHLDVYKRQVMSREMIMKEYIDVIRCRYDYILIDCMPSLGMMTINALVSSDSVLIPVQAASV